MINIKDKHNCCGCNACVQCCPKHCISFNKDDEGFYYPQVDETICVNCHLCEKVCPYLNHGIPKQPITCYAARNKNEQIRNKSSSGGVFTLIAEIIIENGGVVFGARYDDSWKVIHACAVSKEELAWFRGSKYVQSQIGNTYKQAETYLKGGKYVLFSGTPCQILGLRNFLHKDYENLLTVDVVCHGVPSPGLWHDYFISLNLHDVCYVSHKDKEKGWRNYSFSVRNKEGKSLFFESSFFNKYLMAFGRNLTLRSSCFRCPAKAGRSGSDLTLADFWGIENICPKMDDNKGTSFVGVNTIKGMEYFNRIKLEKEVVDYNKCVDYNPCIEKSTYEPIERLLFWENYRDKGVKALFALKQHKFDIIKRFIKRIIT